jgi:hypothetical protein
MGWYVTCTSCGREEKYRHPDCDCRLNTYFLLFEKLQNASVQDCFTYDNYTYRKYNNCCTQEVIDIDNRGDWDISPYETEISILRYNRRKLHSYDYIDESIDKLFLFHQFLGHCDILSIIGPLLNDIWLEENLIYKID